MAAAPAARYADLAGRTAVVTAGSRGIGAATCRLLAANGVKVTVCSRGEAAVGELVEELRAGGAEATGFCGDASVASDMEAARAHAEATFGPTDILVAFAGGFTAYTPVAEISEQEWRDVFDWNVSATFLTVKAFLPGMIERRRGSIVTMASNAGRFIDVPLTASYAAAKAAIVQYTRHLAKEVGAHGVRANCIAPGTSLTERVDAIMPDDIRRRTTELSPLGRLGLPEDSANATVFLASDAAGWLTGVTLDVNGGRVMM
jgi:3-oxoacyl-[acyl-carrier protein] reductase